MWTAKLPRCVLMDGALAGESGKTYFLEEEGSERVLIEREH